MHRFGGHSKRARLSFGPDFPAYLDDLSLNFKTQVHTADEWHCPLLTIKSAIRQAPFSCNRIWTDQSHTHTHTHTHTLKKRQISSMFTKCHPLAITIKKWERKWQIQVIVDNMPYTWYFRQEVGSKVAHKTHCWQSAIHLYYLRQEVGKKSGWKEEYSYENGAGRNTNQNRTT